MDDISKISSAGKRPKRTPGSYNSISERARTDTRLTAVDHRLLHAIEKRFNIKGAEPYWLEDLAAEAVTTRESACRRCSKLAEWGYIHPPEKGVSRRPLVLIPVHDLLTAPSTAVDDEINTAARTSVDGEVNTGVDGAVTTVLTAPSPPKNRPTQTSTNKRSRASSQRERAERETHSDDELLAVVIENGIRNERAAEFLALIRRKRRARGPIDAEVCKDWAVRERNPDFKSGVGNGKRKGPRLGYTASGARTANASDREAQRSGIAAAIRRADGGVPDSDALRGDQASPARRIAGAG